MSDKTVKFNIGGLIHEVSQSVLDMHPDSMLAKSASELWKKESDIFIERDGARFRFVLDYMRDGKVNSPSDGVERDSNGRAKILWNRGNRGKHQ
jgi:hypothetical protein